MFSHTLVSADLSCSYLQTTLTDGGKKIKRREARKIGKLHRAALIRKVITCPLKYDQINFTDTQQQQNTGLNVWQDVQSWENILVVKQKHFFHIFKAYLIQINLMF